MLQLLGSRGATMRLTAREDLSQDKNEIAE